MPEDDNETYPFQIDGNQGNASGVLMMLMDDYAVIKEDGNMEIHIYLLPALPEQFATGYVKGMKTKGDMELSMEWKDGKLLWVEITGCKGTKAFVHYQGKSEEICLDTGRFKKEF